MTLFSWVVLSILASRLAAQAPLGYSLSLHPDMVGYLNGLKISYWQNPPNKDISTFKPEQKAKACESLFNAVLYELIDKQSIASHFQAALQSRNTEPREYPIDSFHYDPELDDYPSIKEGILCLESDTHQWHLPSSFNVYDTIVLQTDKKTMQRSMFGLLQKLHGILTRDTSTMDLDLNLRWNIQKMNFLAPVTTKRVLEDFCNFNEHQLYNLCVYSHSSFSKNTNMPLLSRNLVDMSGNHKCGKVNLYLVDPKKTSMQVFAFPCAVNDSTRDTNLFVTHHPALHNAFYVLKTILYFNVEQLPTESHFMLGGYMTHIAAFD